MALSTQDLKFFRLAVSASRIGKSSGSDVEAKCPVCGDSKNKNKKRLHLYNKNNVTQVNCFNGDCAVTNKTMYSFLRDFYPALLSQYRRETFSSRVDSLKGKGISLADTLDKIEKPSEVQTQDLSSYMMNLNESTEALDYLNSRLIPYTERFGKWYWGTQDLKIGDTLYCITNSIIVPLYYNNEMYGFYSRNTKEKSFITYMNDVNIGYKIWNWFNINKDEPVYIFEGIFDAISSNLTNSIALLGAKLPDDRLKQLKEPVFCLDNDTTGIKNMIQYSKMNHKVYIQPSTIIEKDFNEIIKNHPNLDTQKLVQDNIYYGLSAQMRLKKLL